MFLQLLEVEALFSILFVLLNFDVISGLRYYTDIDNMKDLNEVREIPAIDLSNLPRAQPIEIKYLGYLSEYKGVTQKGDFPMFSIELYTPLYPKKVCLLICHASALKMEEVLEKFKKLLSAESKPSNEELIEIGSVLGASTLAHDHFFFYVFGKDFDVEGLGLWSWYTKLTKEYFKVRKKDKRSLAKVAKLLRCITSILC